MTVELSFCCKPGDQGKPNVHTGRTNRSSMGKLNGMTYLDQSADDAERRKPKVFKRSRFGSRVEERVQEQWDVGCIIRCNTKCAAGQEGCGRLCCVKTHR